MRITNNMMLRTTTSNINGNKVNVNSLNNQMSSQKKISRPSEDPVVAIRALRLRGNLSEINQYYKNNIPDAEAWLNVTETALNNMKTILTDIRSQCVYGATDALKTDDRKTILTALEALREQVYAEGNSDYAGRTVFTGYRTNSKLLFMEDDSKISYNITQTFSADTAIEEHRYYDGQITLGTADEMINASSGNGGATGTVVFDDPTMYSYDRIRFGYGDITTIEGADASGSQIQLEYKYNDPATTALTTGTMDVTVYDTYEEWYAAMEAGTIDMDGDASKEAAFIKDSGELILSNHMSAILKSYHAEISVDYNKTGFVEGEVRPEYYYNCTDVTDARNKIEYIKYDENGEEVEQNINYIISMSQTLTVNTSASSVFDSAIGRDVDDMISAVQAATDAHDKVAKIEEMMKETANLEESRQKELQSWLDAAKKEADYADDNLQKMYNSYIGKFDEYLTKVNLAITTVGSKGDRLELTETRVSNQQLTVETLKSTNEDRELSDIIIEYTAAYTAYQSSLQAAGMLNQTNLLNYI